MPTRLWFRLAELLITATLAIAVLSAWRADRRDRAQLAADLAAAKQALAQADARQHERDAQLVQTLATLAAEKRTVTTPAQIVRELPQQISLPSPIVLQPAPSSNPGTEPTHADAAAGAARDSNQTQAVIPADDLKPLYDFALDCKACQSKLSTAQGDLTDERAKTAVFTRERDEAVRAAKWAGHRRRFRRHSRRSPPLSPARAVPSGRPGGGAAIASATQGRGTEHRARAASRRPHLVATHARAPASAALSPERGLAHPPR
jgi:type II secretory pathway pseudopilin PulG